MRNTIIKLKIVCPAKPWRSRGFTLVESLVAIAILSLSVVATFTAVQNGLQNSTIAKDQTTAFYLAQEGMEFIKNKRDENALLSINGGANTWLSGMYDGGGPCSGGQVCRIDSTIGTIVTCGTNYSDCQVLNQQNTTGLFGYTSGAGWNPTIFKRGIKFIPINVNEVEVRINMSWSSRWGTKSFEVNEIIFNRQ